MLLWRAADCDFPRKGPRAGVEERLWDCLVLFGSVWGLRPGLRCLGECGVGDIQQERQGVLGRQGGGRDPQRHGVLIRMAGLV